VIIKRLATEGAAKFLLNSLCTALAILIMHINEQWTDFVESISQELSESVDHATCLLLILKYMASDCDNDSIVIEDSIRQNFFQFVDAIAPQVFDQIFNQWAQKLLAGGLGLVTRESAPRQGESLETLKMQRLRSKLVEAFYHWIKLKLPDRVF
jgi:Exportin 1-like protein